MDELTKIIKEMSENSQDRDRALLELVRHVIERLLALEEEVYILKTLHQSEKVQ